jgi:hypothetical protein
MALTVGQQTISRESEMQGAGVPTDVVSHFRQGTTYDSEAHTWTPVTHTQPEMAYLDLVEAATHLGQALRCLWWSWLSIRGCVRDSAIYYFLRLRSRLE